MKKISSFIILTLISAISFTSCLNDENYDSATDFGVFDISNGAPVLKGLGPTVNATELVSYFNAGYLTLGDCYLYSYTIHWDLPENTEEMFEANGYYKVTINGIRPYNQLYINSSLNDTSTVAYNEYPVEDILIANDYYGYSRGYFFMTHRVKKAEEVELSWSVSYDAETMTPTEDDNGARHYDLFIRASKTSDSDKDYLLDHHYYNALNIRDYLMDMAVKEKEHLQIKGVYSADSRLSIRFNYVSAINDGEITWDSKEYVLYIDAFLKAHQVSN